MLERLLDVRNPVHSNCGNNSSVPIRSQLLWKHTRMVYYDKTFSCHIQLKMCVENQVTFEGASRLTDCDDTM